MFKPFENRLIDAIEHLSEMQNCYFDPQSFRRILNAEIQAIRNVTFVLQKCGSRLEGFEQWYKAWQEIMRSDQILKWLIGSRNRIVKEGDLETYSLARIQVYRDWNNPPITTTEVSPNLPPEKYAINISKVIPDYLKTEDTLLLIERRWVDKDFPDFEIVYLLNHCVDVLIHLADSISTTFGYTFSQDFNNVLESRKKNITDFRTCWLKLHNNELIYIERIEIKKSDVLEDARNRYKSSDKDTLDGEFLLDISIHTAFQKMCSRLFQQGLIILRQDAYHAPIALAIGKNQDSKIFHLPMSDRAEKNFQIRAMAEQIKSLDLYAVILISEAWTLILEREYNLTSNLNDDNSVHRETLGLCGVTCEGEYFNIFQFFERIEESIWFPSKASANAQPSNIMAPIYEALVKNDIKKTLITN